MEHKHLDAAALERLLAMDRTAEQNEQLFHLLAVCPVLPRGRRLAARASPGPSPPASSSASSTPPSPGPAPRLPSFWKSSRLSIPRTALPASTPSRRFVSWGLCELLVRESRQAAPEQASDAFHLADLAVHVADLIPAGEPFEEQWIYQLRALAWAALGNAHTGARRSLRQPREASRWPTPGGRRAPRSTGDALGYEPILLDLKASLRTGAAALPRSAQAARPGRRPLPRRPTRAPGSPPRRPKPHLESLRPHRDGRLRIRHPGPEESQRPGSIPSATPASSSASATTSSTTSPRWAATPKPPTSCQTSATLAATQGSTLDRLRLTWVEGRIAAGLGDHDQARRLLTDVRQAFLADGNPYEAALATLDLVIPDLEEGNTAAVQALADEMVTVFRAHNVSREALAALLLFQEAARRETATTALARRVAASLVSAFFLRAGGRGGCIGDGR